VHDYSGHPGQAQLSRALAVRGHRVVHQHCSSYSTGKGAVERQPGDPAGLSFVACTMRGTFNRYSVLGRVRQEVAYGWQAGRTIAACDPDVAILSNIPLVAHALVAWRLRRRHVPMVFWHQDIYSAAIATTARKKMPFAGGLVAALADRTERSIARCSAAIVPISPTFLAKLAEWGVAQKATVVPNWAPLGELPVRPKMNPWSRRAGLAEVPVVLYCGTLGLKHDPSILADLAQELARARHDARVVVVSEGKGRDRLEEWKRARDLDNLLLFDYQPYEDLPDVLASADVLVALLEPDASRYSVPSKVLTYLCAARPVMAVMPSDNAVAAVVAQHHAGVVVDPADRDKVVPAVVAMLGDTGEQRRLGRAGRSYAEAAFSPEKAADAFEAVISRLFVT
jgi:colanic acid biosynthesis glycosyl transferase WcaI